MPIYFMYLCLLTNTFYHETSSLEGLLINLLDLNRQLIAGFEPHLGSFVYLVPIGLCEADIELQRCSSQFQICLSPNL